jgi:hypothetical protein
MDRHPPPAPTSSLATGFRCSITWMPHQYWLDPFLYRIEVASIAPG